MTEHNFDFVTNIPKKSISSNGPSRSHFMWAMPAPAEGRMAAKTVQIDESTEDPKAAAAKLITRLTGQGVSIRKQSGEDRRFSVRTVRTDDGTPYAVQVVRTR